MGKGGEEVEEMSLSGWEGVVVVMWLGFGVRLEVEDLSGFLYQLSKHRDLGAMQGL